MASMLSARSPTYTHAALPAAGRAPASSPVHTAARRHCAFKRCAVVAANSSNGSVSHTSSPLRPGETAEQAAARRAKESARVEERTKVCDAVCRRSCRGCCASAVALQARGATPFSGWG